jgi:malate dehydrogenase (oxaloacetate-decarboxylating)
MIATGSPFKPVAYGGVTHEIAQANNALVFPGIGLGTVAVRASRVTDGMIAAASEAVAEMTRAGRPGAPVLPSMRQLRAVSAAVAVRVAQAAVQEGVATVQLDDPIHDIYAQMWDPQYPQVDVVTAIDEPSARPTEP